MRARVLLPVGVSAFVLALPSAASAAACTPPYCPSHTVTVNKAGTGTGTVTSSPAGIACGSQCSAPFEEQTTVTLTPVADPGSAFGGWSGGGCSGAGNCVLTMGEANITVTATFNANAPPPPNNFTLGKVKHPKTGVVTIRIRVPGPGIVNASGRRMKRVTARAKAAGTYTLKLRLTRKGMKELRKSKGRQLRIKVTFAFTPTGGTTRTKLKKIIFRVVKPRASASALPFDEFSGGKVVVASTATIKPNNALIRVFCNGPQSCHGKLKLIASGNVTMGSSPFDLAAGVSRVLHMKLTGRAKRLLEGKHVPKARAAGTSLHPHAVKLKLASG